MSDLDSQVHHEQFSPGHEHPTCIQCGLKAWHDRAYKPMYKKWADWCYTCQIAGETAVLKARADGVESSEED